MPFSYLQLILYRGIPLESDAGMVGNGYLTSTWDHCTEEMNVNIGNRLSPACPRLSLTIAGLSFSSGSQHLRVLGVWGAPLSVVVKSFGVREEG